MIIECVNCGKRFQVNSDQIPSNGRTIQCGSCNHVWFFNKNDEIKININKEEKNKDNEKKASLKKNVDNKDLNQINNYKNKKEIVKYQKKTQFSFSKLLAYIFVFIISFIGLIIVLDTFKRPLENIFPDLELFLFSLFETLKDMFLFIKDLK